MQENIQQLHQLRESKIESLYERLVKVKSSEEQQRILRELERVVGIRLIYE
jgi:hypothetical protein